jgi:HEPN domain-containing protein
MPDRSKDWLLQAERDLEQARSSMREGRHEWACFAAQQAAEKAAKGLHLAKGRRAWGTAVAALLTELPLQVPDTLVEEARVLDNHYAATRCVKAHPAGAPFEHYGSMQSQQAIEYAGEILDFARSHVTLAPRRH